MKLNEVQSIESQLDKIKVLIKRDCQPFLKESKKEMLFRGLDAEGPNPPNKLFFKKNIRKKRKVAYGDKKQTVAHLDKLMLRDGFKAIRSNSALFAGSDFNMFSSGFDSFGIVHVCFPIGNFNYTWSTELTDYWTQGGDGDIPAFEELKTTKEVEEWWNIYKKTYVQNKNLAKAISIGNEILISGPGYYALNYELMDQVYYEVNFEKWYQGLYK